MTSPNRISDNLSEEELLEGNVTIVDELDNPTVNGEGFDQRSRSIIDDIYADEWENSSVSAPQALEYVPSQIDNFYGQGVYKVRSAMLIHGHDYLSRIFDDDMEALKDAMIEERAISTDYHAEEEASGSDTLLHELPLSTTIGFYAEQDRLARLSREATQLGLSRSCYIRHCIAVSCVSTNVTGRYHGKLKQYINGLAEWIEYRKDKLGAY